MPVSILSHIQGDVNVIHKFDAITLLWLFLNHSCSKKTQLENQCWDKPTATGHSYAPNNMH